MYQGGNKSRIPRTGNPARGSGITLTSQYCTKRDRGHTPKRSLRGRHGNNSQTKWQGGRSPEEIQRLPSKARYGNQRRKNQDNQSDRRFWLSGLAFQSPEKRKVPKLPFSGKLRDKVKAVVNSSNYGAETKVQKLAPIVRGWRNYHRYCKMDGSRFSLWYTSYSAYRKFLKQPKIDRYQANSLVKKAFPTVQYSENRYVCVKGDRSPYDGEMIYWSKRKSKLYESHTAKALKKQNHSCGHCGLMFVDDERIHLHHVDGNHSNWKTANLMAVHQSCHQKIHRSKSKD